MTDLQSDPRADEILPAESSGEELPGVYLAGKLDLVRQSQWKYRSMRNVLRDIGGGGRHEIVWAKGARIPDEEARRQGIDGYFETCPHCDGSGTAPAADGSREPCKECYRGSIARLAPWAQPEDVIA